MGTPQHPPDTRRTPCGRYGEQACHRAAYGERVLRVGYREGPEHRLPEPSPALLALGNAAAEASRESGWDRLSCYAFSASEALDRSPIKVDRHPDSTSPEVGKRREAFARWIHREKARLERRAAEQLSDLGVKVAAGRRPTLGCHEREP